jgi:hypothetical protein
VVVSEFSEECNCCEELALRLRRSPMLAQQPPKVVVAPGQIDPKLCDSGVVVGKLSLNRDSGAILNLRFRRLAPLRQQAAKLAVAVGQVASEFHLRRQWITHMKEHGAEVAMAARKCVTEFSDGGVVVRQLLLDRDGGTKLDIRRCKFAGFPQQDGDPVNRGREIAPSAIRRAKARREDFLNGPRLP